MSRDLFKNLGIDIAQELNNAMGASVLPTQLISRTVGTPSSTNLTGGAPITEQAYNCRGFLDQYDSQRYGESTITQGTRVVAIFGASLPTGIVPKNEDRVVIEGSTFVLTGPVVRDPASALYVCELRA